MLPQSEPEILLRVPRGVRHVSVYGSHEKKGKRWEIAGTETEINQVLPQIVEHPPKNRFVRYNPYPNVVLGDFDTDIVKVDWDERPRTEVKLFSRLMNERYSLDGYIILQSSIKKREIREQTLDHVCYSYKSKSYHTVFNRVVNHEELNSILAWLCLFTKDNKLITWFLLQNIKGTYTLRHGFKHKKSCPKIIYKFGNQDKQIEKFLANRNFILNFLNSYEGVIG
jgi:hypothetical protein